MKYNFDQIHDRAASDSSKWALDYRKSGDVLPLWVADMDFACAEPIVRAIRERAEHPLYGYGYLSAAHRRAVTGRLERLYGWHVDPEWLVFSSGLNPAITSTVGTFVPPGGGAILQSPRYSTFWHALADHGRRVVDNPLRLVGNRYEMDFADLERRFAEPDVTAFILCSPHNPVGRVWTADELHRVGELAARHDAVIISDEIYSDMIMSGHRHTPIASLSPELAERTVTLMSPGKCFNIGGLFVSYAIIPNAELRQKFIRENEGVLGEVTVFGLAGLMAAYNEGDEWLTQARDYVEANYAFMKAFVAERLPAIGVTGLEGTYLSWLDCRRLPLNGLTPDRFCHEYARVRVIGGQSFGAAGEGFVRLNLACPRAILKEALERVASAVDALK